MHKPPYGTLTAIDLNRGEQLWQVPLGDEPSIRNHPLLRGVTLPPLLGVRGAPGPIVTRERAAVRDGRRAGALRDRRAGRSDALAARLRARGVFGAHDVRDAGWSAVRGRRDRIRRECGAGGVLRCCSLTVSCFGKRERICRIWTSTEPLSSADRDTDKLRERHDRIARIGRIARITACGDTSVNSPGPCLILQILQSCHAVCCCLFVLQPGRVLTRVRWSERSFLSECDGLVQAVATAVLRVDEQRVAVQVEVDARRLRAAVRE